MSEVGSPLDGAFQRRRHGATLFIASSMDVRDLRLAVHADLSGFLHRLDTAQPIAPWEWETSVADRPMDQRLSRQENLGRPSDAECVGTICLFGERIGYPLREFDPAGLPDWPAWSDAAHRWRAVHPWPTDSAEQRALVQAGGFPVSGTVFEALDALGAGRPVHIAYIAERAMPREGEEWVLNKQAWRAAELAALPVQSKAEAWLNTEYRVQVGAVENFLRALSLRTTVPFHRDRDDALPRIRAFVRNAFQAEVKAEDNPYRFLDYYDIGDHGQLVGREAVSRQAADAIRAHAANPQGRSMILRLTGESGCGKTSCLRAGILGALLGPSDLGRFRVIAVRPTEFHDDRGQPDRHPLATLLKIVDREVGDIGIRPVDLEKVMRAGPQAPKVAVEVLERGLAALDDRISRKLLVIGLDQFEEIVDDLAEAAHRPYAANWRPLLGFVERAARVGRFAFVFTLESSRRAAFERLGPLLPQGLREAQDLPLGGHSDAFLEQVIRRPFARARLPLSRAVVDRLIDGYRAYADTTRGHASCLPLLALKLSNLFDELRVRHAAPRRRGGSSLGEQFDAAEEEIGVAELGDLLDFDNQIEELANSVWEPSDRPEVEQIDDLDPLLQPLVALGGDFEEITLQTVGDGLYFGTERRLAAFERVRLVVREYGRRRLVHEAVIRQWPLAAKWLAKQRDYLIQEAVWRVHANAWASTGRAAAMLPGDDRAIDFAAVVLRHHNHLWPSCGAESLPPTDRNLREYCLQVFLRSTDPRRHDGAAFASASPHIHIAAANGLIELIERYAATDPGCIDLPSGSGRTPLAAACWSQHATVQRLLALNADPTLRDNAGWTPLSVAVWQRDDAMFRILAPFYRTVDSLSSPNGGTLLHVAARRGAVAIATALIETVPGLDPTAPDKDGFHPVDYAAAEDEVGAFRYFLDFEPGRGTETLRTRLLHLAARNGSLGIVREILALPMFDATIERPDANGMTALMLAAGDRHDAVVTELAGAANVNAVVGHSGLKESGWSALHFAIRGTRAVRSTNRTQRRQTLRTVQALLASPELDPMIEGLDGSTPIGLAGELPQVRAALMAHPRFQHGVRLPGGETPLNHVIAKKDRLAVERLLHAPGVDPELCSSDGSCTLALLIDNDMIDLAAGLLARGRVRPWQVPGAATIGLSEAIRHRAHDLVEAILALTPNAPDDRQRQHLVAAARTSIGYHGPLDLLRRLLDLGAHPDASNLHQWNLFHVAAAVGHLGAFELLAERWPWGPSLTVSFGRQPADVAPDALREAFVQRQSGALPVPPDVAALAGRQTNVAPKPHDADPRELFRLAKFGDVAGLEALLADPEVSPDWRDAWGRSAVDVAPDGVAGRIADVLDGARQRRKT